MSRDWWLSGARAFCCAPQPASNKGVTRSARGNTEVIPRRNLVKRLLFYFGIGLLAAAVVAPLEGRFATHMLQHLLIGDLAPLSIVLGVDGPFLRPVLRVRTVRRLRIFFHPLVALPLWAADLCAWHTPYLYDLALRHEPVHDLQHALFFSFGVCVWAALLEPLPGPAWFTAPRKLAYVAGMWAVMMALSQTLLWSGHPYYTGYSLADQRAGGGVMLFEGTVVMIGVAVWLLLRIFHESESRQRLLEAGVRPAAAARAARYGRA